VYVGEGEGGGGRGQVAQEVVRGDPAMAGMRRGDGCTMRTKSQAEGGIETRWVRGRHGQGGELGRWKALVLASRHH
jgi:hypothetical protein